MYKTITFGCSLVYLTVSSVKKTLVYVTSYERLCTAGCEGQCNDLGSFQQSSVEAENSSGNWYGVSNMHPVGMFCRGELENTEAEVWELYCTPKEHQPHVTGIINYSITAII